MPKPCRRIRCLYITQKNGAMWKEWLTFSRGERYGIVTLSIIIILLASLTQLRAYIRPSSSMDFCPQTLRAVDSFINSLAYHPPAPSNQVFSFEQEEVPIFKRNEPFPFDPNTITLPELQRLGFSSRQAQAIDRYRKRFGPIRTASEFQRIYVVDSLMFTQLEPYIQISNEFATQPQLVSNKNSGPAVTTTPPPAAINLNTADTLALMSLRGIGRGYARRIVAYREMLGGFHSIDQLDEVYGFPVELKERVKESLFIDSTSIRSINLNLISYQELRNHPYINDYQARSIIYYRETMGGFKHHKDLINNKLLDSTAYKRFVAYADI
jgi:competence protein ComEA